MKKQRIIRCQSITLDVMGQVSVLYNDAVNFLDHLALVTEESIWSTGATLVTAKTELLREKPVTVPAVLPYKA